MQYRLSNVTRRRRLQIPQPFHFFKKKETKMRETVRNGEACRDRVHPWRHSHSNPISIIGPRMLNERTFV